MRSTELREVLSCMLMELIFLWEKRRGESRMGSCSTICMRVWTGISRVMGCLSIQLYLIDVYGSGFRMIINIL